MNGMPKRNAFLVYSDNDICCFSDPFASHFKELADKSGFMPDVVISENIDHTMKVPLVKSLLGHYSKDYLITMK